jgi:hypothetical protein
MIIQIEFAMDRVVYINGWRFLSHELFIPASRWPVKLKNYYYQLLRNGRDIDRTVERSKLSTEDIHVDYGNYKLAMQIPEGGFLGLEIGLAT